MLYSFKELELIAKFRELNPELRPLFTEYVQRIQEQQQKDKQEGKVKDNVLQAKGDS